ncbi:MULTISPECIES: hypothetical protein [Streptomyces]|uniref:hypothetical protein n=1 Tax=Streptomyces TaxID=1883 RepID=UPI000F710992|nr:hypothetical protein [Streptomyces sp. W1SF4]AZM87153.1 hypothetical protein D1J60_00395 [Streptomyces sp. W1SF4]
MLITHALDRGTLTVKVLHGLDITNRAAVAFQIEALVTTHHPEQVVLELPAGEPGPATLSAMARTQRMCRSLDIAFTVTGAPAHTQEADSQAPERLATGARRDR